MGRQVWVMVSRQDLSKIFRVIFQKLIFRTQTDGDLFYKTKSEEPKCPKYEGKIN